MAFGCREAEISRSVEKMMKKGCGDDCLYRSRIHEWFTRFQEGREALGDDERLGLPRNVVNEDTL